MIASGKPSDWIINLPRLKATIFAELDANGVESMRDIPPDLPEDLRIAGNGQVETDATAEEPTPDPEPGDGPEALAPGTAPVLGASPEEGRPPVDKNKATMRRRPRHRAKVTVQAVMQK